MTPTKPRQVIILDAENPLREIHGEFFWAEDHRLIVEAARAEAFEQGLAAGAHRRPRRWRRGNRLRTLVQLAYLTVAVVALLHGLTNPPTAPHHSPPAKPDHEITHPKVSP